MMYIDCVKLFTCVFVSVYICVCATPGVIYTKSVIMGPMASLAYFMSGFRHPMLGLRNSLSDPIDP